MSPSIQQLPVEVVDAPQKHSSTESSETHQQHFERPAPLEASKIQVNISTTPRDPPSSDASNTQNHQVFTDHMITVSWTEEHGWAEPCLSAYGPLALMPSASVVQYATTCFEGMKVFRGFDGKIRLVRPMYNCYRMVQSAQRISLPSFEPEELLKLVQKLCAIDCPRWLPADRPGSFLYIRPTLIGDDPCIGFQVPSMAKLVIFMSHLPLPQLDHSLTGRSSATTQKKAGLKLLASGENEVRAWPGGTGFAKIGANYGPSLLAYSAAKKSGYDQVLWLLGPECQVTEAGSTNFFVIWRSKEDGELQLVTAPLDNGIILAGVTRQSILDMSREKFATKTQVTTVDDAVQHLEALEVVERNFTMFDITAAVADNRLLGAFAVGTANFILPVSQINFRDQIINIEVDAVPHVAVLRQCLGDIMYGTTASSWTVEVDEEWKE